NTVGAAGGLPADVDVCRRKISYRSNLVVLSFLDSRLYAAPARLGSIENWATDFCNLRDLGRRQRGRRVDFLVPAAARPLGECVAKMGDARLRDLRSTDCGDFSFVGIVVHDFADWTRGGSAPGIFGESLHAHVGFIPD